MLRPLLDTFQIGWICALPIEAAAAAEMLDEGFGILDEQDAADTNTYTLGRIGKHNVVIACLPGGQYGTTSATTVANNMIRTFSKSLRIGLMVGIGGGIPSTDHDIRLGDVVISYPQGTCGGVIQYDMGKALAGGEFERTGSMNSPPRALLTAVGTMRAAALRDDPRYLDYLQNAIGRTARTRKNFSRPAAECDRLFQAKHDHPANASSCDGCPAGWEDLRSKRENSHPQPHYGIIASGNSVVKHGQTRERLRATTGALCFEMEAAGLTLDFPCIVIRGVCDYADSHKNKQWQGYAALAAAAYTKELLGYVPSRQISQEGLVVDICNGLRGEIQGTNQRLDRAYDQQEQHHRTFEQQRCHQAFKVANYEDQKNINPKRAEGTCQWTLHSPEYIRWCNSNSNDLLWVSADPGCGKSVLARSIVDDYLEASDPAVTICYFFFKDNDEQNHLATALSSVLHQLFTQRPRLLFHAMSSWERNGDKIRQEVNELWRIFLAATSASEHYTICVFDALDECLEIDQDRLIQKLESFYRPTYSSTQDNHLKFLVTSRPYDHIQDHFRVITDFFPHIHIKGEEENDRIHEEIDLVVKIRVRELAKTVPLSPDIHQWVEERLLQMEHRTYLWLHLAIDDIRTSFKNALRPTRDLITLVPSSVNAAYGKILCRVPNDQKDIVRKILEIIVAARRPLTVQEMAIALGIATCPESRTTMQAGLDPTHLDRRLRHLCGLFVFIKRSKIYLIHQTAREFLIEGKISDALNFEYWRSLSSAEDRMAQICLRYLSMEDLEDGERSSCCNIRNFLEYSAVHWADHVRKMTTTSYQEMTDQLHQVYDMTGTRFMLWFPIFWKAVKPLEIPPKMKALHLAAFNGHDQKIHSLLAEEKTDINAPDDTSTCPVMWASLSGHEKAVQMLLEQGADINVQGGGCGNALQAACLGGHDKIAYMLLERGADVNARGGDFGNALQAACLGGHERFAYMLLERGADVNTQGGLYGNALQAACSGGYNNIAYMLLERGADINAKGGHYGNALQAACSEGHDKVAYILLERGADINAQGGAFGNALQAACLGGHDKIAYMLLERGADANNQGSDYKNALQAACSGGHDEIAYMLLERGADVNAQGGHYGNALQAACSKGYDKVAHMLLERGADSNAQGGAFGNALQAACSKGYDKVAHMLLERGADVNAKGGYYGNALQAACSGGYDKITYMLLEGGADVNARGGNFGNALQAACSGGYDKIAYLLLERGADVNAKGGYYGNALQAACSGRHDKITYMLLERGANVNGQGGDFTNKLQAACLGGHDEIAYMLLDLGADVKAQGGNFGNALNAACLGGHDKITYMLLEQGADVSAQDGLYGNALQAACSKGHDKVVHMLLEQGAEVNTKGGYYGNALQAACSNGHAKVAHMLLEQGADVNAQGGYYGNPLQAAYSGGYDRIVQMLLQHGADQSISCLLPSNRLGIRSS